MPPSAPLAAMASGDRRPHIEDIPGHWPSVSANSFREQYLAPAETTDHREIAPEEQLSATQLPGSTPDPSTALATSSGLDDGNSPLDDKAEESRAFVSPSPEVSRENEKLTPPAAAEDGDFEKRAEVGGFEPIKTTSSRPNAIRTGTGQLTQDDLARVISRKRTQQSGRSISSGDNEDAAAELAEIEKLMTRIFGRARQESEEERTRHVGLVFKNLNVTGMGLGAALQPTLGDPFLNPFRLVRSLLTKGNALGKPPVRTILHDFSGCVRPGEMLLVLGRPGSGCSTFLKVLANQRFGYVSVDGDVLYGGTDAATMAKNYRGEVVYNPEDDLHYATLSVKRTLSFALKTRTPGKASRNEGETRKDYVTEFLRVVSKLFWIEHTMNTKVGDEYIRGVSGGEKKRVSIAEAMITKASVQCWDNSTRGLDASTALEYVEALRSLTNMAHISTSVALYQAGESLFDLFDKVVLIDEGRCLYFGPTKNAAAYFDNLGFARPARWTTADFVSISLIYP